MALKKIDKSNLGATINVTAKITYLGFKKEKQNDSNIFEMRIKYRSTQIFIYEKKLSVIKKIEKYNIGDIVEVTGYFVNNWFPGAKSNIPVIEEIINIKRTGILDN